MSSYGLTTSDNFLTDAGAEYFNNIYENPSIKYSEVIDRNLSWTPSLHFRANKFITIAAEVSETPYPAILRLTHSNIIDIHMPISVYCICPEEVYLQQNKQREVKALKSHGYGLMTVDSGGVATKRFGCIPLVQHIPETELNGAIKSLPKVLRVRIKQSYESYNNNSVSGVKDLSEILEELIIVAGKKAARSNCINSNVINGPVANILDALLQCSQCNRAAAAIGGARSYISDYRNTVHHTPKSKQQAYRKYVDCLHGFREGLRRIISFKAAMRESGFNISVSKL